MSKVKLLDIEEIGHEVFTRWDITGHQVNRHLLSKAEYDALPASRSGMGGRRTTSPPWSNTAGVRRD
jgi:hypothetical protein